MNRMLHQLCLGTPHIKQPKCPSMRLDVGGIRIHYRLEIVGQTVPVIRPSLGKLCSERLFWCPWCPPSVRKRWYHLGQSFFAVLIVFRGHGVFAKKISQKGALPSIGGPCRGKKKESSRKDQSQSSCGVKGHATPSGHSPADDGVCRMTCLHCVHASAP